MANNKIQVKRTSTSGRTPNTTNSGNTQFIDAGELALNMADGILYTSNGSALIPVGSNNVNLNITGNAAIKAIIANGSLGSAGQTLTTNGTGVYWTTGAGTGTVTQVNTGIGLSGGPISSTGTISVVPNTGIIANTTGVYVNSSYIATISANAATYLNGKTEGNLNVNSALYANASVTNTFTIGTSAYSVTNGNFGIGTASPSYKLHVSKTSTLSSEKDVASYIYSRPEQSGTASMVGFLIFSSLGSLGSGGYKHISVEQVGGGYGVTTEVFNVGAEGNGYFAGNVGIGNTTPAHKLRVTGTTSLAGAVSDITTLAAGNTTITGFINATSTISTSAGANGVQLTNATSNWIGWNNAGVGAPTNATTSAGTKLVLYPSVSSTGVDYGIGIESGAMWFSSRNTGTGFKWYSNTTNIMSANTSGLNVNGVIQGQSHDLPSISAAGWVKVGTFTALNTGQTIRIRAYIHEGYNALNNQDFYLDLFFKTSNGASVDGNGFAGNSWYYITGFNGTNVTPKWKANASGVAATSYDLYLYLPAYTLKSHYIAEICEGTTWTDAGATGQTDPGSASATVCVASSGFNVMVGNVGIGNTAPTHKLSVNGTTYLGANVTLNAALIANGDAGTAGHVLHSNGTATYWAADDQGVTSVASGNGLTGGTITATGTVSVLANTGIVANATGVYVNSAYIGTLSANNTTYVNGKTEGNLNVNSALTANNADYLDGQHGSFYTNATNITTGTLPYAQIPANIINTTAAFTRTGITTFNANVVLGTAGLSANGSFGTAGHTLHTNGTTTYWAADDQGVTSVASGSGLTGGPITATGTLSVLANTGIVANATGLYVNSAYIATLTANAATQLATARNIGDTSFNGTADIVPSRTLYKDTRGTNYAPFTYQGISLHLKTNTTDGLSDGGTYHGVLDLAHWSDSSGGVNHQLGFTDNNGIYMRSSVNSTAWGSWIEVMTSDSTLKVYNAAGTQVFP